mmetsp:Transcript_37453/g.68807  ORF Transcript_37453/g.68807 Transcript_37453/m.68807 type:complete len:226 (-) Transcript_37453:219-896(-)
MTMTYSPVVSQVLDDTVYTGLPLSQEGAIFDSSPSLLVPKSNNSTTALLSESFVSYVRYDGLITFVSGAVFGTIGSVIILGLSIVFALLVSLFGRLMTCLLYSMLFYTFVNLSGHVILWALSKQWHPSALRDRLVVVPSENLGQLGLRLGLGFGLDLLGMQVLIGIRYGLSAGNVAWLVLIPVPLALLLCTQWQYYNRRAMERSNNSQHSGNIEHTDSFLYAQIV